MKEKEFCPFCKTDLTGEPIPEKYKHHYGESTHYSRKIGIYDSWKDRTVAWQCPDCDKQWNRD